MTPRLLLVAAALLALVAADDAACARLTEIMAGRHCLPSYGASPSMSEAAIDLWMQAFAENGAEARLSMVDDLFDLVRCDDMLRIGMRLCLPS